MSEPLIKYGMAPLARSDARVLILGSLPGDASLAAQQYYAHPTNQFWRLIEKLVGQNLVGLGYDERGWALLNRRIALWDVVATGTRTGSLDQKLKVQGYQDIAMLVQSLSDLRLIAFNGTKAAAMGAQLSGIEHIHQLPLPSSSAANTTPFAEKLRYWTGILEFLE
jgi:double-stranded uracil-DNA glycosylase